MKECHLQEWGWSSLEIIQDHTKKFCQTTRTCCIYILLYYHPKPHMHKAGLSNDVYPFIIVCLCRQKVLKCLPRTSFTCLVAEDMEKESSWHVTATKSPYNVMPPTQTSIDAMSYTLCGYNSLQGITSWPLFLISQNV